MRQNSLERNKTHLEELTHKTKKRKQTKTQTKPKNNNEKPNNKTQTGKDVSCLNMMLRKLRKRAEMIVLCVSHRGRQTVPPAITPEKQEQQWRW